MRNTYIYKLTFRVGTQLYKVLSKKDENPRAAYITNLFTTVFNKEQEDKGSYERVASCNAYLVGHTYDGQPEYVVMLYAKPSASIKKFVDVFGVTRKEFLKFAFVDVVDELGNKLVLDEDKCYRVEVREQQVVPTYHYVKAANPCEAEAKVLQGESVRVLPNKNQDHFVRNMSITGTSEISEEEMRRILS